MYFMIEPAQQEQLYNVLKRKIIYKEWPFVILFMRLSNHPHLYFTRV